MIGEINYKRIFEQQPANFVVFRADDINYTVVAATDSHLKNIHKNREEFIGTPMFFHFPDVSGSKSRVIDCIKSAIETKTTCKSEILRYDIPTKDTDVYETRYWTLDFSPVLDENGEVEFITQLSTDITNLVNLGFKP